MISLAIATPDDLTAQELDTLRMLRHQTADGPIVYALCAKGLASWVDYDDGRQVARLTAAGREIADSE